MRILITIVHHCNPKGDGRHGSLMPDTAPRLRALQDQLLSLRRLDVRQGVLNIRDKVVNDANQKIRHQLDVRIITDGEHHLIDQLGAVHQDWITHVPTTPDDPKKLGFEAQKLLAENVDNDYDLYTYLEDDLIIVDPFFFHKINWFQASAGNDAVLLPQRMELFWDADDKVDKFYVDGPISSELLEKLIQHPSEPIGTTLPGGDMIFTQPENPHSGCFILTNPQMRHWSEQEYFLDGDCSFISPLESAATLGLCKTFKLYKPHFSNAAFLELQHWGINFRSLIQLND